MKRAPSSTRSSKYPNLYIMPNRPFWVFRKYSSEKGRDFYCSTGIDATERNAAQAYKVGLEKFNVWLGAFRPADEATTIGDLLDMLYDSLDDPSISDATRAAVRNQGEKHLRPAIGKLKPRQVNSTWWDNYQREERKRPRELVMRDGTVKDMPPRTKFFNTRKVLRQVLGLAKRRGLIAEVPQFELKDAEPAPPKEIAKADILRIIRFAGRIDPHERGGERGAIRKASRRRIVPLKLLVLIMWKQGARPSEVLQYRWEMIDWRRGAISIPAAITKTRRARTIPLNPKVLRVLRFLHARKESAWIFPSPSNSTRHMTEYKTAWRLTVRRLGLQNEIYNLRDSFISQKLREGLSAVFIAKYLDNSATMIERRYAVASDHSFAIIAGRSDAASKQRGGAL